MTPLEEAMKERLGNSWFEVLQPEINKPYFPKLAAWVAYVRQSNTIYPDSDDVFRAYKICPFNKTKVIILGQDPYTDGSANGLCFGYKDGVKASGRLKSLDIIFRELEDDISFGLYLDQDYELSWLAQQGVLLLNTILTVKRNEAKSHKGMGWENFTSVSLAYLYNDKSPKVFMLWGQEAQQSMYDVLTKYKLKNDNHLILKARHPAADIHGADSFNRITPDYPNTFLGCKHFSKANEFLKRNYIEEIRW